jgi:hypothetical protein
MSGVLLFEKNILQIKNIGILKGFFYIFVEV